jgi:histidinol phosphatase-like enzyme
MTTTFFCDIDGIIFKHQGDIIKNILEPPEILNGVIDKFKEWDKDNYKIILTT